MKVLSLMLAVMLLYVVSPADDIGGKLHPVGCSGDGSIQYESPDWIQLTVDTATTKSELVILYAGCNTAMKNIDAIGGYFWWDGYYTDSSAATVDTMIITVKTGYNLADTSSDFSLDTDTILTVDSLTYSILNTNDTLIKPEVWIKVRIIDSVNSPLLVSDKRNYRIQSKLFVR